MWSPVVLVLLVASVRADADADADADAEPFLPYTYPQYNFGSDWAAAHFGQPHETLEPKITTTPGGDATYRPSLGFVPSVVSHSPFLAIRDVQAPPASILQFQKPVETHDVQILRHPGLLFAPPPVPLFIQTSHIRVPDHKKKDPIPVPIGSFPGGLSFASQHTAQVPIIVKPPTFTTFGGHFPLHVPLRAPSFAIQHTAQVPVFSSAFTKTSDDDDDDDDDDANVVYIKHFPTELASLTNLRNMQNDPVIPAGIVQSTQPIFKPVAFKNSKAHPDLLGTLHKTRDAAAINV